MRGRGSFRKDRLRTNSDEIANMCQLIKSIHNEMFEYNFINRMRI